jgi:hypothetical protein
MPANDLLGPLSDFSRPREQRLALFLSCDPTVATRASLQPKAAGTREREVELASARIFRAQRAAGEKPSAKCVVSMDAPMWPRSEPQRHHDRLHGRGGRAVTLELRRATE